MVNKAACPLIFVISHTLTFTRMWWMFMLPSCAEWICAWVRQCPHLYLVSWRTRNQHQSPTIYFFQLLFPTTRSKCRHSFQLTELILGDGKVIRKIIRRLDCRSRRWCQHFKLSHLSKQGEYNSKIGLGGGGATVGGTEGQIWMGQVWKGSSKLSMLAVLVLKE